LRGAIGRRVLFFTGFLAILIVPPSSAIVSESEAGQSVIPPQNGVIDIVVHCLPILYQCLGHPILFLKQPSKVDGCLDRFGTNLQFLFQMRFCGLQIPQ